MKKVVGILAVAVLVLTLLVGCNTKSADSVSEETPATSESSETPDNEEQAELSVLNYNLGADPKTVDPSLNDAIDGSHIINNTFEALTREIDGQLTNAMAETIDISDDGLEYVFHLRDANWSDGQAVTANDFEYGWKRVLNPETAAPYAPHMFYIKNAEAYYNGDVAIEEVGIVAVDDKTFKVTLEAPTPYLLSLITRPAFMPLRKDIIEASGDAWAYNPETAISNGPFVISSYVSGDKIVLKKNVEYWNKESVSIDQINCLMIVEESTALTAFDSGDLDIINKIPQAEIPNKIAADPEFYILPMLGTYYLEFNVNIEPLNDVRVRKALSLAVNRQAITENVKRGGEIPATGFNPVGLKDSEGNDFNTVAGDYGIDVTTAQLDEAKALLADAGYPNGEGFPEMTLLYNTSESHKAVCEAIQEMWKQGLGVNIKLQNQEWAVFQTTRTEGNFEICRGGYIGDYPDPVGLLELMIEGSPNNHPHWVNKEFNDLIKASRYVSGKERDEMVYKAEKIFMDDAPIAPLFYYTDPVMVKDGIDGWQKNSMSYWYFGKVNKN